MTCILSSLFNLLNFDRFTKILPLDKNKSKFVIGKNNDKISIISLDNEK